MQPTAKVVEGDEEGLGEDPHADHDREGDGPQGEDQQVRHVRVGRVAPEDERRVHRRHHVHHVQQEHEAGHVFVVH